MAGIVKSTKRRFLIGKRIKEVEVPGTVLDTDLFFADLTSLGANRSPGTMTTEFNALPSIVKNEAVFALVRQGYKTGFIYGINGDTKSVETFIFERNSSGTSFQNGSVLLEGANVPRIDTLAASEGWGPTGYLFEKASTNLRTYSGMGNYGTNFEPIFSSDKSRCSIVSEAGKTCIKVEGTGSIIRLNSGATLTTGTVYTWSLWVKAGADIEVTINNWGAGIGYNHERVQLTTSWKRVIKTFTVVEGASSDVLHISSSSIVGVDVFIADIQLEEGGVATSYIPTTDSAATRLADKLTSTRPIAVYPKNSFYIESDFYTGWFGDGIKGLNQQLASANFVRKTRPEWEGWISSTGGYNQTSIIYDRIFVEGIYFSEYVTVSFELEYRDLELIDVANSSLQINYYGSETGWNNLIPALDITSVVTAGTSSGIARFSGNLKTTAQGLPIDSSANIRLRRDYITGDIRIKKFKIESGQNATPWSPAPEDVVSIDAAGNLKIESNASHNIRSLSLVPRALTQEEI